MSLPLLTIDHVTVRYLTGTLFTNLSFNAYRGHHYALVGESGAGKSALLQTIVGRFNMTGGEIGYHFDDFLQGAHTDESYDARRRLIAIVEPRHYFKNRSHTTDFYYQQRYNSSDSEDAATVEEYLNSVIAGCSDAYWTPEKVMILLRLGDLREKQLIKLSNGETKRLMLAAALLKNPVLLLLDNPLTGLDVETRTEFDLLMGKVIESGITVIMATSHYEIPAAITDVVIMEDRAITRVIPKADFDPGSIARAKDVDINGENLAALLNNNRATPPYRYIVKMTDVRIKYADKIILDKINWQILPGERWALLGPNGAGKSTLLSLVNGDNPQAYANDIILFDKKRGTGESIWDIKSKTGFVSPELHQYFPMDNSCLQVVESGYYDTLGLFRQSAKTKADAALKWMAALEIEKYARVPLKNIPASAQRLCLLARALIKNPDLLIFDEPCQGLDAHQQQHFKTLIDTICRMSNVTLIYVTHYQDEIPESVTNVLRLDSGRIV